MLICSNTFIQSFSKKEKKNIFKHFSSGRQIKVKLVLKIDCLQIIEHANIVDFMTATSNMNRRNEI